MDSIYTLLYNGCCKAEGRITMPLSPFWVLALVTALVVPSSTLQAAGPEQATPQEVVQKVQEAVLYLAEAGEAGLAKFRGKGSDYVWKDTYIFVSDCDKSILLAHPIMPEREGQPIAAA
jgi:cytochrome c